MPRSFAPVAILVVVIVTLLAACAGTGSAARATPAVSTTSGAPTAAARKPTFVLEVVGGPAEGHYTSAPTDTLLICSEAKDGSWRAMYGGGDPWVNIDLLVGPEVATPGHASDAALEVTAGTGYLWIDQGGFRGGDAKGRSTIEVTVQPAADLVTFHVAAATPNRTPQGDGPIAEVILTVACPA